MAESAPPVSHGDDRAQWRRQHLEKLRHDLAAFIGLEVRLEAAARRPQLRQIGASALGAGVAAVAVVTAFALVNVAAVLAIATLLPAWSAALILAGAWVIAACVAAAVLSTRTASLRTGLPGGPAPSPEALRAARDEAWRAVQSDLAELAPPLAERAVEVATPIAIKVAKQVNLASAGGIVEGVAGEAEAVEREVVEESEELFEAVAKEVPGAGIAGTVLDLALLPGRTGVRMVSTVFRRPPTGQ